MCRGGSFEIPLRNHTKGVIQVFIAPVLLSFREKAISPYYNHKENFGTVNTLL